MKAVLGPVAILVLTVCLLGCRTDAGVTEPVAIGPDTFALSSHTSSGGTDAARETAIKAASQQCASLSQKLVLVTSDANIGSSLDEGVVNLKFRCVAPDVPQSPRPKVQ